MSRVLEPFESINVDVDQFMYRDACPSCGSYERELLSDQTAFRFGEDFPSGRLRFGHEIEQHRRLYDCAVCGLWYFSHVPTKDTLRMLLDQPSLAERWGDESRLAFVRGCTILDQLLPEGGDILDIGAHTGGFLSILGEKWRKSALEPMATSCQRVSGVRIFNEFLEEANLPESTFACISAFDVFEHFYDPNLAIARIRRSLQPEGLVIIETGNTASLFARLLRAGWYYLSHFEHLQAFSERSLTHLLMHHGFRVLRSERVYRDGYNLRNIIQNAPPSLVYTLLTLGRQPKLWRYLSSRLRPGHNATPPRTVMMEPDHLFVVAQKLAS